jgi:hypothetical protein
MGFGGGSDQILNNEHAWPWEKEVKMIRFNSTQLAAEKGKRKTVQPGKENKERQQKGSWTGQMVVAAG